MQDLPIVYCRGYAGPTDQINSTVNDPFYGFNEGATHTRVNGDGDPKFYQFEGPLLRLLSEHDYSVLVRGSQGELLANAGDGTLDMKSIWIHRFYDEAATTYAPPPSRKGNLFQRDVAWTEDLIRDHTTANGFDIERAATELYELVMLVRQKTGAPMVNLVAHSMGGLVARCMMQKICESDGRAKARETVSKLFTYATPHGGIVFTGGLLNWAMETFGPGGSDIFSPPNMYGYLTAGAKFGDTPGLGEVWDPRGIPDTIFDVDNVFCLIGTDPNDYNLVKLAVGPRSDGLVLIENAYVKGAHRAFAYKSHSGPYGEVNSEEGYQNLSRFLFGHWSVKVELSDLPNSTALGKNPGVAWQADMQLAVRGLSVLMTEQKAAHYCPVQLNAEVIQHEQAARKRFEKAVGRPFAPKSDTVDAPVPLVSTFLFSKEPPLPDLAPTNVSRGVGDDPTAAVEPEPARELPAAAQQHRGWHHVLDELQGHSDLTPAPLPAGAALSAADAADSRLDNPLDPNAAPTATASDVDYAAQQAEYLRLSENLSRYALTLKVYQVTTNNGLFDFSNTLEQVGDWQDVLIVDIGKSADGQHGVWTGWKSDWKSKMSGAVNTIGQMPNQLNLKTDEQTRTRSGQLNLPDSAKALPAFGANAQLSFVIVERD